MSEPVRTRSRRSTIIIVGLVCLAALIIGWLIFHKPPAKKAPPPSIPVTAVKAVSQDFQLESIALGAAQAWTSDMIYAQVSGKLILVNFTEGSDVRAGQVLAEVDPRPYQAVLIQAQGALKRDEANLAGARRDLTRYQNLGGEGGVSRQVLEDQVATVGEDEGTVELDRGAVSAAKINLEFCRIVSPVSGRAGVRLVDPGNLVSASGSTSSVASTSSATSSASASTSSAGTSSASSTGPSSSSGSSSGTGIVIINQIQPIAITFTVPQGQFQHLVDVTGGFKTSLPVSAISQETGTVLDSGELKIADNRVDQATGTVELKARFPNTGTRLWPGQFVNVRLGVQKLSNATILPLGAINRGPKGQFVFVIGADNKAAMRPITLVTTQGQTAVIKSGVQPGDVVVVDGQMVLSNGSPVRIAKMTTVGGAQP